MRFALVSHILPPSPSGQAVVLYRNLSGVDTRLYYLINTRAYAIKKEDKGSPYRLCSKYYTLPPEPILKHPNRFKLYVIRNIINIIIQIYFRTQNIIKIIQSEPETNAIIACSGDIVDIPAGFLASRKLKLPFFAYIFDDYVYQWTGYYRNFAKIVAPYIFKHSSGIIGPNEIICSEYQKRYNITPLLVRNPCEKNEFSHVVNEKWPSENGKIKIIYTGAIYLYNYDCFHDLIQSMSILQEYNLELHLFTAQAKDELETQGIVGPNVFIHTHVPYSQIIEQQHEADILFLPLSFESKLQEVVRTSAPGKMGEYLASGRPVLAHVPSNSAVAYYFTNNNCGWVTNQKGTDYLCKEIGTIISNTQIRKERTQNAIIQAKIDYSPEKSSARLIKFVQKEGKQN